MTLPRGLIGWRQGGSNRKENKMDSPSDYLSNGPSLWGNLPRQNLWLLASVGHHILLLVSYKLLPKDSYCPLVTNKYIILMDFYCRIICLVLLQHYVGRVSKVIIISIIKVTILSRFPWLYPLHAPRFQGYQPNNTFLLHEGPTLIIKEVPRNNPPVGPMLSLKSLTMKTLYFL